MITRKETVMIVCNSADRPGIEGTWMDCSVCKKKVFFSKSTWNALNQHGYATHGVRIYCVECGYAEQQKYDVPILPLTHEQLIEINRGKGCETH